MLTDDKQSSKEDDGDVFLGEANALRYVHDEPEAIQPIPSLSNKARFRYSVPNGIKADALMPPWESERRQKRINDLSTLLSDLTLRLLDGNVLWMTSESSLTLEQKKVALSHCLLSALWRVY